MLPKLMYFEIKREITCITKVQKKGSNLEIETNLRIGTQPHKCSSIEASIWYSGRL